MARRRTDLPHVTDILAGVGIIDTSWFTDYARDRGTAVHLAAQYLDEGTLDRSTLDPAVRVRLRGYEQFLKEVEPEILHTELALEHKAFRYCGTTDRVVIINGRWGVLDIKPPAQEPWHGLQLAAYLEATKNQIGTPKGHSDGRWSLHLGDGSYKLIPHHGPKGRNDWPVFMSALNLYNWMLAHGVSVAGRRKEAM